jgi:ATP phosphoribosyltransferase regulatory subunit HisZ
MRELRAIEDAARGVFEARGYGEVATPALEYETVLVRGDAAAAEPAYRLFDEQGNVLVLRSDFDDPDRPRDRHALRAGQPPLRFCYLANAYRVRAPAARAGARDAAGGHRARRPAGR